MAQRLPEPLVIRPIAKAEYFEVRTGAFHGKQCLLALQSSFRKEGFSLNFLAF
jgi:hypothetical protein